MCASCLTSNFWCPNVPQAYFALYMGKQGASVPSVRMISQFCPARQPQCSPTPRMKPFMFWRRGMESTIFQPPLFVDEPVQEVVDDREVLRPNVGGVLIQIFDVVFLHHWPFFDLTRDRHAFIAVDVG